MSLSHLAANLPVHFPADPDKFAFDGEVSQIFPDMARRSIPSRVINVASGAHHFAPRGIPFERLSHRN